ncbi:hypothetical protein SCHPADRAFT_911872 [Schizopora paradoxa]|uniref:Uncharacterized protein n=1 Tax=Schizopora paradoxa TaxID=27342 RepID=A0A0H2QYN1_9AGAM|nr:hypothetical protein SCHPADRAFT_911872 [Schizopora paradoxa]
MVILVMLLSQIFVFILLVSLFIFWYFSDGDLFFYHPERLFGKVVEWVSSIIHA